MTNLGGLHDRESTALGVTDTWVLDTIALLDNPSPHAYDPAYAWIVRCNWSYGDKGTLPTADWYGEYVARLVNYVRGSTGCHRWIIGNEPNLPREWPQGQPIFPWQYADVYKAARRHIHTIPGHERDEVLIAASGPWNADLKYTGNANGDWITYFEDVIDACGNEMDGFALHSYTHGYDVGLVTSEARMDAPFQHRRYEFRTYRDYMNAIPVGFWSLPVYLTEANGNGPWQAVGLMPAMLGEIDGYNRNGNHPICAVVFYRYPKYDENAEFAIEGKPDVIAEYKAAIAPNGHPGYTSPVVTGASNVSNTVHMPYVPNESPTAAAPALPPVEWDERLTARGVTVQTPPNIKPGQQFWRVVKARWYDEQEADLLGPDRHIMLDVRDESGARVVDAPILVTWPSDAAYIRSEAKAGEEYACGYGMSASRNEYDVYVDMPQMSERVYGIGMGADTPDGFNAGIHTSTGVVFQLVTMPASTQPAPPAETGTPATPQTIASVPPLTHPIADPALRVISQRFGENPQDYAKFGLAGHNGVDFAVPSDTPIFAVDDGSVMEVEIDYDGYGMYAKVRHAWGESLYAHLLACGVGTWQDVKAGDRIGLSGNSGNSTGPHLHFAMRVNPYARGYPFDGYTDPLPYLASTPTQKPINASILSLIKAAAAEFGLDWRFVASLAWYESSWMPTATSPAGAMGIMQLMPATWAEWSAQVGANNPYDERHNILTGAAYLAWLMQQLGNKEWSAVVAYNFGIGNLLNGVQPPRETIEHADRVIKTLKLLEAMGL